MKGFQVRDAISLETLRAEFGLKGQVPAGGGEVTTQVNRTIAAQIVKTLEQRTAALDDPRTIGSSLTGDQAALADRRLPHGGAD